MNVCEFFGITKEIGEEINAFVLNSAQGKKTISRISIFKQVLKKYPLVSKMYLGYIIGSDLAILSNPLMSLLYKGINLSMKSDKK